MMTKEKQLKLREEALELFTVQQIAKLGNCSVRKVRDQISQRQLGHYRIGRLVRVSAEQFNRWLLSKECPSARTFLDTM